MGVTVIVVIVVIAILLLTRKGKKKPSNRNIVPGNIKALLAEHVKFYSKLSDNDKDNFEARLQHFLQHVAITGIGTTVEDLDHVLIAAGAIIPIFAFPDWSYKNISEVLVYKDTFSKEYEVEGDGRNILGMVGDGALNGQMILSQSSVRASFRKQEGHNTVIHEFAHLIDKADGSTDGIPEYLLADPYIYPWIRRMRETIQDMQQGKNSDINFYGATNESEFFAVMTEYFFERPGELKTRHPQLFAMLDAMFTTKK